LAEGYSPLGFGVGLSHCSCLQIASISSVDEKAEQAPSKKHTTGRTTIENTVKYRSGYELRVKERSKGMWA
jgi:hypothetical protein